MSVDQGGRLTERRPPGTCGPATGSGCATPRPANSPSVSWPTTWSTTTGRSGPSRRTAARASASG